MTPALSAVYDELLGRAASGPFAERSEAAKHAFAERTGVFEETHDKATERLDAAWEDALVASGIARSLAPTFEDPGERALVGIVARAQRGVFELRRQGDVRYLRDRVAGASFVLLARDEIARNAFATLDDQVVLIGRVVAAADGCAVLPGFVFLPPEALPFLDAILFEARARELSKDAICDALLRMDHALATLARVKASFAFRIESLPRK